jgi:hypothetical protein
LYIQGQNKTTACEERLFFVEFFRDVYFWPLNNFCIQELPLIIGIESACVNNIFEDYLGKKYHVFAALYIADVCSGEH